MRNYQRYFSIFLIVAVLLTGRASAQERSHYQYWLELAAADQTYADRALEIGRSQAFLEFLGEGSVVFRGEGPVDALEEYSSPDFQGNDLTWESHYIDVARAGDLGLSAGPMVSITADDDRNANGFGHLVSVWWKQAGEWKLAADMFAFIPGYLSLEVEPSFDDTQPVFEETALPAAAEQIGSSMQSLIDADTLFGRSINIRGGKRALLRYGMENMRVYLPGMGPAIGGEVASSVYGAYLDDQLKTTTPVSLESMGGYLSESGEMGFTYGIMSTSPEEAQVGFSRNYLRLWRLTKSNEWRIAVEVLRPL